MAIHVKGYVDANGVLRAQLPEGYPEGEIEVTVSEPIETASDEAPAVEPVWTEEEIAEMLKPSTPKTGKEIAESDAIGGWSHMGITDSVAFIEEFRRKNRERRRWPRD